MQQRMTHAAAHDAAPGPSHPRLSPPSGPLPCTLLATGPATPAPRASHPPIPLAPHSLASSAVMARRTASSCPR